MNSNLVPERRSDKNGVVSTKWVRPAGSGCSSAVTVPAPLAPAVVHEGWDALIGSPIDEAFKESWLGITSSASLSQFDYEAVCIVNELLERKPDVGDEVERVFNQADEMLIDEDYVGDPFLPMNHVAVFGEVVLRPDVLTGEIAPLVNGLNEHFGAGRDYLHGVTDAERRSAVALVTMITSLKNEEFVDFDEVRENEFEPYLGEFRSVALRSAELAELVKAHPDEAEDIARIVNERDSDNAVMVAVVLGSGNKAMREGVL